MSLLGRHCSPCHPGTPPLTPAEREALGAEVPGWIVRNGKLCRTFVLPSFREAMALLEKVADLAEAEGHHPDFCVSYRKVEFSLWTHAINDLSMSDYVLAARIDALAG